MVNCNWEVEIIQENNLSKKSLVFLLVGLFVGIAIAPSINADISKASVNRSPYTLHAPIYINGNDDFTIENGVTGGSGTFNDPFVIEDWKIEASTMDGITIRNVNIYFIIMNCFVHDGSINNDGIVFINVTNGVIEDTFITGNRNGVMFRTQPLEKENSENNIIQNNTIISNKNDGINFEHTGYDCHRNNIIFNNSIVGNNRGIFMIMSANNQIVYNNIFSNYEVGIRLEMCMGGGENNIIYQNNIIDNGDDDGQAFEDGGPQNKWDDDYPSGGNYWNDYTGIDNNGDGIGDTPYPIPGGNNEDRYPLMDPNKDIPPYTPTIDGPPQGKVGIEYCLTFHSEDPNGDDIMYIISWGDGEFNTTDCYPSCTEIEVCHTYYEKGIYYITAQAKECPDGLVGPEATFTVSITKNKAIISPFLNFIHQYTNLFPILTLLLKRLGLQN